MINTTLSRRTVLAGGSAVLAGAAWPCRLRADTPQAGGRLIVAADSEPRNLNPAIVASNGVFFVASKIVEPLAEASYRRRRTGSTPRLAISWEGSADGLTATFKLRDGVKWHDGKPFTSADVAFSALQVWKPLQNLGRVVFKDLEAVDTPDALTAVFRFAKPTPFQLIRNALPALTSVVPKHIYDGRHRRQPGQQRAGRHRAVQVRRAQGRRILPARANADYWGEGQPYLDEIVYQGAARPRRGGRRAGGRGDPARRLLGRAARRPRPHRQGAGHRGDLQGLRGVDLSARRRDQPSPQGARRPQGAAGDRPCDRQGFRRQDRSSSATPPPATGPVPQNDKQFYTADVPTYPFDVAKANALLDEAGYKRGADGTRFKLKLLPAPYFNETKQFGDYLRQALADDRHRRRDRQQRLRRRTRRRSTPTTPSISRWRRRCSAATRRSRPPSWSQSGIPDGVPFSNQGGYANAELDALIAKAAETLDAERAHRALQGLPETRRRRPAADQRRRMGLHHRRAHIVKNVSNNPRWAVSNWADTWLDAA